MQSGGKTAKRKGIPGDITSLRTRFEIPLPPGSQLIHQSHLDLQGLDREQNSPVRVVILQAPMLESGNALLNEVCLYSRAQHPNIPNVLLASIGPGFFAAVVESCHGGTLEDSYPQFSDPAKQLVALRHATVITSIIESIHDANALLLTTGLPSFRLRDRDNRLMLADTSCCLPLDSQLARERLKALSITGLLEYIAPEQTQGTSSLCWQTDLFGIGATLYRMLSGRPIYATEGALSTILAQAMAGRITDLGNIRKDLHPGIIKLVRHCLMMDPQKRPASASEVMESLRGIFSDLGEPFLNLPKVNPVSDGWEAISPDAPIAQHLLGGVDGLHEWLQARIKENLPQLSSADKKSKKNASVPKPEDFLNISTPDSPNEQSPTNAKNQTILKEAVRQNAQSLLAQLSPLIRAARNAADEETRTNISSRLRKSAGGVFGFLKNKSQTPADEITQLSSGLNFSQAPTREEAIKNAHRTAEQLIAAERAEELSLEEEAVAFANHEKERIRNRKLALEREREEQHALRKKSAQQRAFAVKEEIKKEYNDLALATQAKRQARSIQQKHYLQKVETTIHAERKGEQGEWATWLQQELQQTEKLIQEKVQNLKGVLNQATAKKKEIRHQKWKQHALQKRQKQLVMAQAQQKEFQETVQNWQGIFTTVTQRRDHLLQTERETWTSVLNELQSHRVQFRKSANLREQENMSKHKKQRQALKETNRAALEKEQQSNGQQIGQKKEQLAIQQGERNDMEKKQEEETRERKVERLKSEKVKREDNANNTKTREAEEDKLRKELFQIKKELEERTTELDTKLTAERDAKVGALKERNELAEARGEIDLKYNELQKRFNAAVDAKDDALKMRTELTDARRELESKIAELEVRLQSERERMEELVQEQAKQERHNRETQEQREKDEQTRLAQEKQELNTREKQFQETCKRMEIEARDERDSLLKQERKLAESSRVEFEVKENELREQLTQARQELDIKTANLESRLNSERASKETAEKSGKMLSEARNELDAKNVELTKRLEAATQAKEAAILKANKYAEARRTLEAKVAELDSYLDFERDAKEEYHIKLNDMTKLKSDLDSKGANLQTMLDLERSAKDTALRRGNELSEIRSELEARVADLDSRLTSERELKETIQQKHDILATNNRELEANYAEVKALLAAEKEAKTNAVVERDELSQKQGKLKSKIAQLETELNSTQDAKQTLLQERKENLVRLKRSNEELLTLKADFSSFQEIARAKIEHYSGDYSSNMATLASKANDHKLHILEAKRELDEAQKRYQKAENSSATFQSEVSQISTQFTARLGAILDGKELPKAPEVAAKQEDADTSDPEPDPAPSTMAPNKSVNRIKQPSRQASAPAKAMPAKAAPKMAPAKPAAAPLDPPTLRMQVPNLKKAVPPAATAKPKPAAQPKKIAATPATVQKTTVKAQAKEKAAPTKVKSAPATPTQQPRQKQSEKATPAQPISPKDKTDDSKSADGKTGFWNIFKKKD